MMGEIMNYIEYKNNLYLILTANINDKALISIKRKLKNIWNNKYKHLIIDAKNSSLPIPYDYMSLIKYAQKKKIRIVFE